MSWQTLARGAAELEAGQAPLGRVRRSGGGRKRLVDVDPGLRPALLALVEPDVRGDPMSPLRWMTTSTRKLAAELTRQGRKVSADTVGDLLRDEGFSLPANAKTVKGNQQPDRDAQFGYINEQATDHIDAGDPVISVDTKKKELVGDYKTAGASGVRQASRSRSRRTTSWTGKVQARRFPMGSTTSPRTRVGSTSAPTTTPPPSRSPPSAVGGMPEDRMTTPRHTG
jgi:hypothetical protein